MSNQPPYTTPLYVITDGERERFRVGYADDQPGVVEVAEADTDGARILLNTDEIRPLIDALRRILRDSARDVPAFERELRRERAVRRV